MLERGHTCVGYWTDGEPQPLAGFIRRYPDIPRVTDRRRLIEDPAVHLILTAAIPADRAGIAIEAMRAGKDVGTDKPGLHYRGATASLAPNCDADGAHLVRQLF
ncbi:MAG TPA: hypothetical protein VMB34_14600 [Acetobacteraceae bacterium]|nr:hypothetical protein [Acetobacteraceae bacterium]